MKYTQSTCKPLKDNVVILIPELKKATEAGIIIPDTVLEQRAKDRGLNLFCEVVAIGPDTKKVQVGMMVLPGRIPQELPGVECEVEGFKLGFIGEYALEFYV